MTDTFLGYARADGTAGVRNHVLILSVTGLTGPTARRIGRSLPGVAVVATPYGSGLLGEDAAANGRALLGFGSHPNVGAVVVIGADPPKVAEIGTAIERSGRPVVALTLDESGHDALTLTDRATRAGAGLLRALSQQRRAPVPLAQLRLGLECGRSDPSSGLVANPLIGRIADRVVDFGGIAMIGETTEWLGAEHLLAARAKTSEVEAAIRSAAERREAMAVAAGIDLTGNNPGATNIAAGLSSIEEKSLGAIAKSGSRPISGVLRYGERPNAPGLHVMDAPAYAPESLSGFAAAGSNLMLFSTGVGNSFVSALAPTIKLSGNPETCARIGEQLDFDASGVFTGQTGIEEAADALFATLLDVASGSLTWGEILAEGDEVVSRFGAAL